MRRDLSSAKKSNREQGSLQVILFITEKHSERMLRSFYGGPLPLRGVWGEGDFSARPPPKFVKSRLGIFSGALGPLSDYFLDPPKLLFFGLGALPEPSRARFL